MANFTTMSIVCFIQVAVYGAGNLFLPARLLGSTNDSSLCANEELLVPLPCKMMANVLKSGLLPIINDRSVDLLTAILLFVSAFKIGRMISDYFGSLLNDVVDATIISVPVWQATSLTLECPGDALLGFVHTKTVL